MSGHGQKPTDREGHTPWRRQREGPVRTWNATGGARGTHSLETAEGGIYQDTERNRLIEGHSRSGDGSQRDLSEHGKKPIRRGALTALRQQMEGLVSTRKEAD